jgi:hypothetical protein
MLFPFVSIKILAEADFFCYVNRFVGSFQGCLTQNHPKNQQNGSHKIPYVYRFVLLIAPKNETFF